MSEQEREALICPCGQTPRVIEHFSPSHDMYKFEVQCFDTEVPAHNYRAFGATKEDAISVWNNRRAPLASQAQASGEVKRDGHGDIIPDGFYGESQTDYSQQSEAYEIACEDLEEYHKKRAARAKKDGCTEIGTQGSLIDGMAWIFNHLDKAEAENAKIQSTHQQMLKDLVMARDALRAVSTVVMPFYNKQVSYEEWKAANDEIDEALQRLSGYGE